MPRSPSAREREEWRREVALFRYTLVREPADPGLSKTERGRLVRELAAREHTGPDGRPVRVARTTLDDWIRSYRAGGFEALVPKPKRVTARTPARTLELAIALKRERPDRTAAQIHAIMAAAGEPVPCARTLQTHLSRAGLNHRADGRTPSKVYGRFEAAAPNELWTGDGLHGPKLAATGRRAVLLGFIDDHSRLLVGWRWVTGEDVFGLEAALRPALLARGVPEGVLVDRGSAFVSSQLLRACAVLGARLIHASPRAAATKGKIERFSEPAATGFWSSLSTATTCSSPSSTGSRRLGGGRLSPPRALRDRADTVGQVRCGRHAGPAHPALLREAFLWSESRMVAKTATVSLFGNDYEVDPALAGRRCQLLFDPFDLTRIEVRYRDRPFGLATPVRIGRHTHPKAWRELEPPAAPTGIDYLGLLAAQRDAELSGQGIDYAQLADPELQREHAPQSGHDDDDGEEQTR